MILGSKGLAPTYEPAHVGLDLLTLVSYIVTQYPKYFSFILKEKYDMIIKVYALAGIMKEDSYDL